ncbi:predicted protein [Streptomyces albidoflavus]|nr:predicted protein [Streptomyces albidoflavus]
MGGASGCPVRPVVGVGVREVDSPVAEPTAKKSSHLVSLR